MRRRDALAGLGALGILGAGGAVAFGQLGDSEGQRVEPLGLPRIDAPGSPPGTETIPETGRVTYVSMFATWCSICERKMGPLGEAAAAVDDVQFVSVTTEPVGQTVDPQTVVDWWVDNNGAWPVAHDEALELSRRLGASNVPYSAVLDADNRLTWADRGYATAEEILAHIREAR